MVHNCEKCGAPAVPAKYGPRGVLMLLCGSCWLLWFNYISDQNTAFKAAYDFSKVWLVFLVDKIRF